FFLTSDFDARVRFQLAFTLGEIADPRTPDALAAIARRDAADPWTCIAILSSIANTSDQLLARLLADPNFSSTEFIRELAQIIGVRGHTKEMQRVLTSARARDERSGATLSQIAFGIGAGLKRFGQSLRRVDWDIETSRTIDGLLAQAAQ